MLDEFLLLDGWDGGLGQLDEAMYSQEVQEFNYEVASVFFDSFTQGLVFALLQAIYYDFLQLILLNWPADFDQIGENFQWLIREGILDKLVIVVRLRLLQSGLD